MKTHLLKPLLPLAVLALAATACQNSTDMNADDVATTDAPVIWTAPVADDWDVTGAIAADDVVIVATSWDLEADSAATAYDTDGSVLWQHGPGYGSLELAVLDDGTLQVCDDLGGNIVDPATGTVEREATAEECPEDFDGPGPSADGTYEVDLGLVEYDEDAHEIRFHG